MAEDAFEEAEMHDGAPIVYRDKAISRRMSAIFFAIGLVPLFAMTAILFKNGLANAHAAEMAVAVGLNVVMAAFFMLMGVLFGVLRTVVTKKAVHVKYGLWGPTIPLDEIESVRVVGYDWTEFGGWGIRMGRDGARAYVPRNGPVVEIMRRENGKLRKVLIGTEDAAATVAAIQNAKSGASPTRIAEDAAWKKRVADDPELAAAEQELAEEEQRENQDREGAA